MSFADDDDGADGGNKFLCWDEADSCWWQSFARSAVHDSRPAQQSWIDGVTIGCWIYDREVMGSTPGQVTIKWLVLGWVTACEQINHMGI